MVPLAYSFVAVAALVSGVPRAPALGSSAPRAPTPASKTPRRCKPPTSCAKPVSPDGEPGVLCDESLCDETEIVLSDAPIEEPGVHCELQPGLEMDGKPVWACGRIGDVSMKAESVADLGLTMADLEEQIDPSVLAGEYSGYQSSTRQESARDEGVAWRETATEIEAELTLAGLRGQPAGAVAVALTDTTCTVTVFGMTAWSCVLMGGIDVSSAAFSAEDGPGMVPVVRVRANKQLPGRWGNFFQQIGEDSILQ